MKGKILCPAGCQNRRSRITKAKEILKNLLSAGSWRPFKSIFSEKGKRPSTAGRKPRPVRSMYAKTRQGQFAAVTEQVSTTVPKSAILRFCPSRETCWGVPSPNPADRRSAPVLWRSRATKIRQPRLLRSRLTRRKSEAVSAIAAERRTRRNSTPALRLYCSIGPIRQN